MNDEPRKPRRPKGGRPTGRLQGGRQERQDGKRKRGEGGKRFERPERQGAAQGKAAGGGAPRDRANREFAERNSADKRGRFGGPGKRPVEDRERKPFGRKPQTGRPDREPGAAEAGPRSGGSGQARKWKEGGRPAAPRTGDNAERRSSYRGAERPKRPFEQRGPSPERPGKRERAAATAAAAAEHAPTAGGSERIAKRLSRAGIASRRDAEAMIEAGRVTVNGTVLSSPAVVVGPRDRIEVDGQPLPAVERTRLFLFHKPAGVVTTNRDPEGRKTVFDVLPRDLPRLMTVGRLDINTEGLLLLTNDGGLARVLELPSTGWLRRYRVRVHGRPDEAALRGLAEGIAVDGVFYGAIEAAVEREVGTHTWLTVGLREGKNREVKKVLGALGLDVARLIRVSFGPFQLGELAEGEIREIKGRTLRDQLGERLIEEAGANFDAPVNKPFSPAAAAEDEGRPARRSKDAPALGGPRWKGGRDRDSRREDALERLDTRPHGRSEDKRSGRREDERRQEPLTRRRATNVWMAPGARPVGRKKAESVGGDEAGPERPAKRPREQDRPQRVGVAGNDRSGRRDAAPRKPRFGEGKNRDADAPRRGKNDDRGGRGPDRGPAGPRGGRRKDADRRR